MDGAFAATPAEHTAMQRMLQLSGPKNSSILPMAMVMQCRWAHWQHLCKQTLPVYCVIRLMCPSRMISSRSKSSNSPDVY